MTIPMMSFAPKLPELLSALDAPAVGDLSVGNGGVGRMGGGYVDKISVVPEVLGVSMPPVS